LAAWRRATPSWTNFVKQISYFPLNFDDPEELCRASRRSWTALTRRKASAGTGCFYLATAPEFFAGIVENLGAQGMAHPEQGQDGGGD
jgi:glucose-6-phosphate 1-dehydrogenase